LSYAKLTIGVAEMMGEKTFNHYVNNYCSNPLICLKTFLLDLASNVILLHKYS